MDGTHASYAVPRQAQELFEKGILGNPLINKDLPKGAADAARNIVFEGSDAPSIPVNWRFAESIASLKALEATLLNLLVEKKYSVVPGKVRINTDHAQLFILSFVLWVLDPGGKSLNGSSMATAEGRAELARYFPPWEIRYDDTGDDIFHPTSATNIYKTKDGKYFHIHGSMDSRPTLKSLRMPTTMDCASMEASLEPFKKAVSQFEAEELQHIVTDVYRQAGTICYSPEEYKNSEHGQANAHVGLFEIFHHPYPNQAPGWWPSSPSTSAARPLAGLKVVELTRVIAAPVIGRGLAELGASVMRITARHLPDTANLHPDTNHGKWNACLDLREEEDRKKLRNLISDADVFLQGYRPGALDKFGFGEKDIIELCKNRKRGIIYVGENTYGWQGPWASRSGWQQISDANCGVSWEFGRAMGLEEPVTPIFPNSDYCTGVAGTVGILTALLRRAEEGGSFSVRLALNYYSRWLVDSCGSYPPEVWNDVWKRNGSHVFRHYHNMHHTMPVTFRELYRSSPDVLFKPGFFTQYFVRNLGLNMRIVAPVLRYENGEIQPGFDIGTRTNGVDKPEWPEDLGVEVVV